MEYFIYIGTLIAIYTTLTISLNLLVGYTGLISIAQAGIYGVGAYVTALLALHVTNNLLISFVLAALAGVAVSLIVALPSLRLKNEYFLIATMGFQAIIFSHVHEPGDHRRRLRASTACRIRPCSATPSAPASRNF